MDFIKSESNIFNTMHFYSKFCLKFIDGEQNNTYLIHCDVDKLEQINTNHGSIHIDSIEKLPIPIQISCNHWDHECKPYDLTDQLFYGIPKLQEFIKGLHGDNRNKKIL